MTEMISVASRILSQFWDPIGLAEFGDSGPSEYRSYAAHCVRMIESGANHQELAAYLRRTRTVDMGIFDDGQDLESRAVKELLRTCRSRKNRS